MTAQPPIRFEAPISEAEGVERADGPKKAELVIQVVSARAELFHDPQETAFAIVNAATADGPSAARRVLPLRGRKMRSWIARSVRVELGGSVSQAAIDEALLVLEGIARYDRDQRKLHLRVAEDRGNLYVDLGDQTGACATVTPEGWTVRDEAPVLFRRADAMRALPRPQRGGTLNELRPFFNAADDDSLYLFAAWMVAAMRPGRPCPILALHGEQGTAKSTASRVARALVDPNVAAVRSAPRSEDDLVVASVHSHVVAFDNLSGVQPWLSDALCRLATGGGLSKRTLYTDDEETVIEAMRPILVNGIDDLANRPDLAERCLVLELRPIPKGKRRDEQTFWATFEAAAPRLFGLLLDGAASALRELPRMNLHELPRMSDFARWIAAAEPGLGLPRGTLLAAYARNRARVVDVALDASPVATAVRRLLDRPAQAGRWRGEPAQLLAALADLTPGETRQAPGWPRTPRALSSALRRSATFLRSVGVTLDLDAREGHDWRRTWTLGFEAPGARSAPSAPSAGVETRHESADRVLTVSVNVADTRAGVDGADADRRHDGQHRAHEDVSPADGADRADGLAATSPSHGAQ